MNAERGARNAEQTEQGRRFIVRCERQALKFLPIARLAKKIFLAVPDAEATHFESAQTAIATAKNYGLRPMQIDVEAVKP